jgi:hypothetical protein
VLVDGRIRNSGPRDKVLEILRLQHQAAAAPPSAPSIAAQPA